MSDDALILDDVICRPYVACVDVVAGQIVWVNEIARPNSGRARYWAARRRFKLRHLRLRRRMSNASTLELWGGIAACPSYHLSDEEIANDVANRLGVRFNWGTHSAMPGTMELPR